MTPMKIAVISYRLPVEGEKRGGIERVAHVLANGLARRGHAVVGVLTRSRTGGRRLRSPSRCRGNRSWRRGPGFA